jgi:guanylate kinase
MMGIVLYGPPASGKSTVSVALSELDPRFVLVRKLKAGNRRGTEYDFVSVGELAELRAAGRLMVETQRYGNTYAIDRCHIDGLISAGQVPIIHLGNIADIRRLIQTAPCLLVLLWIPRNICEQRSRQRGDSDTAHRLQAWDETLTDLRAHGEALFLRRFRTDHAAPARVAQQIASAYNEHSVVAADHIA